MLIQQVDLDQFESNLVRNKTLPIPQTLSPHTPDQ
jgi:hypothetical protein